MATGFHTLSGRREDAQVENGRNLIMEVKASSSKTTKLVTAAVIAAAYAVLTMFLAPISYGAIQYRISEALCVLPFFFPTAAGGLFVGCLIANLISTAGILDIVFGPLATLLACLCTAAIGKGYRSSRNSPQWEQSGAEMSWVSCILACAMPVVFNGPIIGAILAVMFPLDGGFWLSFLIFGAEVMAGEAVVMFVLGLPLMRGIARLNFFK